MRLYSTSALPAADAVSEQPPVAPAAPSQPPANVYSSLILSRIPIVTPELTEFEKAYYKYQSELERRLMWTFPAYFYFKKGTLSERKFAAAQKGPVTRQPGVWYPRGIPDVKFNRERRFKQEIVIPRENAANGLDEGSEDSVLRPIVGNPRITEADTKGDTKALTRRLDRTLYLLVKQQEWKFPSFGLQAKEPLHEAAQRGLTEIGGPNMYTWTVSNTPCAVLRYSDAQRKAILNGNSEQTQSKEYLIKSHILHGKFVPAAKGVADFAWLTKEEIKEKVTKDYWEQVEVLLSNQ